MDLPFTLFVVSDLHLEFCKKPIEKYAKRIPETDVLILAGDIGSPNAKHFSKFLEICSKKHDLVIFVPGNHEYWVGMSDDEMEELCIKYNVIMLQNEILVYEGITFVGTTLWTSLKDPITNKQIDDNELLMMNDFHYIDWMDKEVWKQKHKTAITFLKENENCIVITHHTPSQKCLPSEYDGDLLNGCYVTNLDHLFEYPSLKAWIFGHTHKSMCEKINGTILFGNSGRQPSTYNYYADWFKDQSNIWNVH